MASRSLHACGGHEGTQLGSSPVETVHLDNGDELGADAASSGVPAGTLLSAVNACNSGANSNNGCETESRPNY